MIRHSLLHTLACLFFVILGVAPQARAADGRTFASFNTTTLTGAGAAFSKSLDTTGMPASEYLFYTVSADFVSGANPAYSLTMNMELNNGGATVFAPLAVASSGALPTGAATTLRWIGILPRPFTGGTALTIKFQDTFNDATGPYTSTLNNVSVTLHASPAPSRVFGTFTTGTLTGAGAAFTKSLDVTGMPASEYLFYTVSADFVSAAAPNDAYSNSMRMELNNGGATIYRPAANANSGALGNATATTLFWSGILPRTYPGGTPLSIKLFDTFNDASGPYRSTLNNVKVTVYPTPAPNRAFAAFNTTVLTGAGAAFTKSLDVTGLPATDYLFLKVSADFAPGTAPKDAYSSTIRMELNNGGSTVYYPEAVAMGGVLPGAGATTLFWGVILPRIYTSGPLTLKFRDTFNDASGPYTSTLNNVQASIYAAFTSPPAITSALTHSGTFGSAVSSYTITASNSPASFGATGLPTGLSIANGVISGTPTQSGVFNVTLSATNLGGTATATLVLSVAPAVTAIAGPAAGSYKQGANLDFTITWNAAVTVTGTPRIPLTVGSTSAAALYLSGSGTSALVFRYTVPAGATDSNGIASASPVAHASGSTIQGTGPVNAALVFTPPSTTTVLVDTTAPGLASIVRQSPATSPTNADTLVFRLTFDEAVQNVGAADFTITGTTATAAVAAGGTNAWDVTLSGGNLASLNATVTLGFAAGQDIQDTAGNLLTNTTPAGTDNRTYTVANNRNPVPGTDSMARYGIQGVKISVAALLANDTDPDGDTLIFGAAGTSPNATISVNGGILLYTPNAGFTGTDSFTYTLNDGKGGTATGTVNVTLSQDISSPAPNLTKMESQSGGGMKLNFAGIPGRSYRVQSTENPAAGPWTDRLTVIADALGRFEFTDPGPLPGSRFYRTVTP